MNRGVRLRHRSGLRSGGLGCDAGLSLVELAVYILVLGVISAVVASVVISLFRSEQVVSSVTTTSNTTQNFSSVFDRDIRNARAVAAAPATPLVPITSGAHSSIALEVASDTATPICWNLVTWKFENGTITRTQNGGSAVRMLDVKASNGSFTVSGRTVSYQFDAVGTGSANQKTTGSANLAPASSEGARCP